MPPKLVHGGVAANSYLVEFDMHADVYVDAAVAAVCCDEGACVAIVMLMGMLYSLH